jgi:hypothetical protein
MNTVHIPGFILYGSFGSRIKKETGFRPKPIMPLTNRGPGPSNPASALAE